MSRTFIPSPSNSQSKIPNGSVCCPLAMALLKVCLLVPDYSLSSLLSTNPKGNFMTYTPFSAYPADDNRFDSRSKFRTLPSITAKDVAALLNAALSPSAPYWASFQSDDQYPMVLGATDNRHAQEYRKNMLAAISYLESHGCIVEYRTEDGLCAHAQFTIATPTAFRMYEELQKHGIHPMPPA